MFCHKPTHVGITKTVSYVVEKASLAVRAVVKAFTIAIEAITTKTTEISAAKEIEETISAVREIEREARKAEEGALTKAKEAAETAEASEELIVVLKEEGIRHKKMSSELEEHVKSVFGVPLCSIEAVIAVAIAIERASRAVEEAEIAKAEEAAEVAKAAEALVVALEEEDIRQKTMSPALAVSEKIIAFSIALQKAKVAAEVAITKAKEADVTAAAAKELLESLKKSINHKIILPKLSEKEKILKF